MKFESSLCCDFLSCCVHRRSSIRAKRRGGCLKSKCAPCHGVDGLAATPAGKVLKAASFKDPAIVKTPDAALIAIVKSGKNKMPTFQAS